MFRPYRLLVSASGRTDHTWLPRCRPDQGLDSASQQDTHMQCCRRCWGSCSVTRSGEIRVRSWTHTAFYTASQILSKGLKGAPPFHIWWQVRKGLHRRPGAHLGLQDRKSYSCLHIERFSRKWGCVACTTVADGSQLHTLLQYTDRVHAAMVDGNCTTRTAAERCDRSVKDDFGCPPC